MARLACTRRDLHQTLHNMFDEGACDNELMKGKYVDPDEIDGSRRSNRENMKCRRICFRKIGERVSILPLILQKNDFCFTRFTNIQRNLLDGLADG